jgi:hypothetical protein
MNKIHLTVGGLFWVCMFSFATGLYVAAKFYGCVFPPPFSI